MQEVIILLVGILIGCAGVLTIVHFRNQRYSYSPQTNKLLFEKALDPTAIEEFVKELEKKKQARIDFFESEGFNLIYGKILRETMKKTVLDEDHMHYFPHEYNISSDEFRCFVEAVDEMVDEVPTDAEYASQEKVYKKLRVSWIHGQGTAVFIRMADDTKTTRSK